MGGSRIRRTSASYSRCYRNEKVYNPGLKRGLRIGSAKDGFVTAFIPDPEPDADNAGTTAAEGVTADANGKIYGAEVGPRPLKKYVVAALNAETQT